MQKSGHGKARRNHNRMPYFDIFISYKRISIETANNLYYRLTQKGYNVFFDLEEMRTDKFPQQIEEYIRNAQDVFILIEPKSLDACRDGRYDPSDWFCREMKTALDCKKHIIPMLLKGFEMPDSQSLPPELRGITEYNAPKFDIFYFDAYIDRLISKGLLNARPSRKDEKLSVFKFISNEDCRVYEGEKLIGAVKGKSNDPFYVNVKRKGQYMYRCVNDRTSETQNVEASIDIDEEKYVKIEWKERRESRSPWYALHKKALISALAVAFAACLVLWIASSFNHDGQATPAPVIDTTTTEPEPIEPRTRDVADYEYTNSKGETFRFTGTLTDGVPNGRGKGVYEYGTYEGQYVDGLRQGDGTFDTSGGENHYEGSFADNMYSYGTLTVCSEGGRYFQGSFQEGIPYTGTWYNADNSTDYTIEEGE